MGKSLRNGHEPGGGRLRWLVELLGHGCCTNDAAGTTLAVCDRP